MEKRKIKNLEVPLLGLGCMRLPVDNNNLIDEEKALKMIDYAYSNNVNYFDTAYPYHQKQSELFLGKALKKYDRNTFYLATKMPIWECKSLDDAKEMFYNQLKRLDVHYFDFYLCHAMNLERHNEYIKLDVYNFLLQMKSEGKIRNFGFSYHGLPQDLKILVSYLPWDFVQLQINYLDWQLQDAKMQYETLIKHDIACIVMEPIRGGALANVSMKVVKLFNEYDSTQTPASYALRYVGSLKNVKIILSGMSNLDQLKENVNTFKNFKELSFEELDLVNQAKNIILGTDFIACTGCRYCMPCKFGVEIAPVFSIYNQFIIDKDKLAYNRRISALDDNQKPKNCKDCKICISKCPQQIDIPSKMIKLMSL